MGRHSRTSTPAAPPAPVEPGRHRGQRRRGRPLRTGLLASSAALAVGAVAVGAGVLPRPGGIPSALNPLRGDGGHTQAGPSGAAPNSYASMSAGDRPSVPVGRGASRAPVHHRPSHTPSPSPHAPTTPAAPKPPSASPRSTAPEPAPSTRTAAPVRTLSASVPPSSGEGRADEAEVLSLVNDQRAKAGCAPLKDDPRLDALAGSFSDEMAARGFFDHTDPDGRTPWDRAKAAGITDLGGENIARGQADPQAVMDAWMNSPGHRANILDCDFKTLGVGVHYGPGGPWWTQDFGY
jgi:uncharacterized protein YkwD